MRTIVVLLIIILALELTYIYVVNSYVPNSYSYYESELKRIKKENSILKEKVLKRESLTFIEQQAREKGFVEVKSFFLLQAK